MVLLDTLMSNLTRGDGSCAKLRSRGLDCAGRDRPAGGRPGRRHGSPRESGDRADPGFPETGDILGPARTSKSKGSKATNCPAKSAVTDTKAGLVLPGRDEDRPHRASDLHRGQARRSNGPEGCPRQSRIADGTVGVADQIGSAKTRRKGNWKSSSRRATGSWHTPTRSGADLGADHHPRALGNSPGTLWAETHVRNPPGRLGLRRAARVRDLYQREGRPAIRKNGKTLTTTPRPAKCPKGGFPAQGRSNAQRRSDIVTEVKVPCPKRSLVKHRQIVSGDITHPETPGASYRAAGVDYETLDAGKPAGDRRGALHLIAARRTPAGTRRIARGARVVSSSTDAPSSASRGWARSR